MKRRILLIVAAVVVLGVAGMIAMTMRMSALDPVVDYMGLDDADALLAEIDARSQDQLLLLMYHAHWCPYCRRMTAQGRAAVTFTDYKYAVLRVDVDKYTNLSTTEQQQDGVPETHVFLNGQYLDMIGGSPRDLNGFIGFVNDMGERFAGSGARRVSE